jgi:TonB-linked SusC/RagA family outer membrane protein
MEQQASVPLAPARTPGPVLSFVWSIEMSPRRPPTHLTGLIALLCFASPSAAVAQNVGTIRGTVRVAETGEPLSTTVIQVLGTSRSALSGLDGSYTISGVAAGEVQVRATFIGYTTDVLNVTVTAGGTAVADFALRQTAVPLSGIVVSATGEAQARRELGNSVGNIPVQEMELGPINTMQELLTGRTAGVTVRSSGGTTGAGHRIRIRGANSASLSNEPLLIIDGVQVTSRGGQFISTASSGQTAVRINDLNPEDIESIEILRGPAASALYGTAAANGVIQIVTRKGRTGPAQWSYYAEYGELEDKNDFPDNVRAYGRAPNGTRVLCPLFGATVSQANRNCQPQEYEVLNVLKDPRTTPFRTGTRHKLGANVSGGSATTTFYLSGELEDENGVYATNDVSHVNGKATVRTELRDGLSFTASSNYVTSRLTLPQNDNNAFSFILNGLLGETSLDSDEDRNDAYRVGLGPDVIETRHETSETDRFVGSLDMSWQALPWLSVSATGGVDYIGQHDHVLQEGGTGFAIFGSPFAEGFRTSHRFQSWVYSLNSSASAGRQLTENIRSTTVLGLNYTAGIFGRTAAFGAGLLGGTESLNGTSTLFAVEEEHQEVITVGTLLRQQLSYRERLFLAASVRGDRDSAFGSEAGLAWYPSMSASWVVSEEGFFPQVPLLSQLRLRAAWGQSGLRPGFRNAETFFTAVTVRVDGEETTGITVSGTGNPDLKIERTEELELGFDLGLVEDRFGVEFTYYDKSSKDALVSRPLAPSLGLTGAQFVNLAAVSNKGAELTLRGDLVNFAGARLSLTTTGSWNKNRLVELGQDVDDIIFGLSGDTQRHKAGYPLGSYFQRQILDWSDEDDNGIIEPGEVILSDSANYLGQPIPTREITIAPELTLFNNLVRITSLFDHQGGHHIYNATNDFRCSASVQFFRCRSNFDPATPAEEQAKNAAVFQSGTFDGFIEPADFWKLREVSVTVQAPRSLLGRFGDFMDGLSLTLSGRNLATWTDYSGIDPEVSFSGHASNHTSADFFTQPPVRYFTARISASF